MSSQYPSRLDQDSDLFQVAKGQDVLAKHHNSHTDALKALQRALRHESDVVLYRDGSDYVVADDQGVEQERSTDRSTAFQAASDEAGSGTVLVKSGTYGTLSTTITGSALFVLNGDAVSLNGLDNLPAYKVHSASGFTPPTFTTQPSESELSAGIYNLDGTIHIRTD